jgi:predicted DNA-binding transcriptional regulator YafY
MAGVNRTDRLYAIAEELRSAGSRGRTSAWLAERFEVSTRTVKRDVTALQQAGVPIWAAGGPGGGYVLDPAATLPPVTFSPAEAVAIAVALQTAPDQPYRAEGRSALTKVRAALTPQGRKDVERLAGRVWIRSGDSPRGTGTAGGLDGPVRRALAEAVRHHTVVVLDYVGADGRTTTRRPVEPMVFANTHEHWYLLAWCRMREAGRWFRLDRITAAIPTHESFQPRDLTAVFGTPPADAHVTPL